MRFVDRNGKRFFTDWRTMGDEFGLVVFDWWGFECDVDGVLEGDLSVVSLSFWTVCKIEFDLSKLIIDCCSIGE